MLLAIDAGNTNTVFAVFDGERIVGQWRMATDTRRTSDEYGVWLSQLLTRFAITRESIKGAVLSTVVPQATFALRMLCRHYFDVEALVVGDETVKLGIDVRVERPQEVGADRLVNAVAARAKYGSPLIILDFGTATTFDIVDAVGTYAGGVIAPGVNLSLEALHQAAAKLPNVAVERPLKVIGTTTVTAMQSGIFYGYIGLIEGIVSRMQDEAGTRMTVVATGGLSTLFATGTSVIQHLDTDLTILGLKAIYHLNH